MRRGYLSLGIKDIFDPKGRIDRLTYWMYGVMLMIAVYVGAFAIVAISETLKLTLHAIPPAFVALAPMVMVIPLFYGQFCIRAKRLHDLGLPAIVGLLGFADTIGQALYLSEAALHWLPAEMITNQDTINLDLTAFTWIFHLLLLFIPGQRGPNRYGESSAGPALPKPKILEG